MKNYLTPSEIAKFLTAAKLTRYGLRNYLLFLMIYRHGLRVSEVISLKLSDVDFNSGKIYVYRAKGGTPSVHPMQADELRTLRTYIKWREATVSQELPYLFFSERGPFTRSAINYLAAVIGNSAGLKVHPHMLRHSTGYFLANKGHDIRLIQDYLGHKQIQSTVRYTQINSKRFENFWR